jgi:signal transduction histidine kinase
MTEREREFLLEATTALAASLDTETVLATLARIGVPILGEACVVHLATSEQHAAPSNLDDGATLVVPLVYDARTLGTLTFHGAAFTDADRALAGELARSGAVALENARLYARACEAVAMRDQMLAMVSHDLRTPLQIIMIAAADLESSSPQLAPTVRKMERAAERMDKMIRDLLDYASIDAGRFSISPRAHDISAIVAETLAGFESVASVRNVELAMVVPDGLPLAFCDRDRVLQVTTNLVGNAMKILAKGGLVVVRAEQRADKIMISVVDTGPGIPAQEQSWLFERYWRGQRTYAGHGLGLAIARGIATAHGGEMWVESEVGRGATFSFTLPLAPAFARVGTR